ncbi:MAG: PAS domain-containing protein [Acidobacteria bacterium]|nr:PAS domain-containing protein [Acidobacteriota bacterium]
MNSSSRQVTMPLPKLRIDQLRLIADSLPMLISYVDADQRYRFNNKQYEVWVGRRRREMYGKHIKEIMSETAYETIREHIEAALAGQKVTYEGWVSFQDADPRYIQAMHVPHVDRQGKVKGFFALIEDITERKRAEAEIQRLNCDLKRRVETLQTLFDVAPVGIAVAHDPECQQITVNPAGAVMLGIRPDGNVSKSAPGGDHLPFKVFRDGKEVPPDELPMQYAAAHDVSFRDLELDIVHDDGQVFNLYEYASPLHDEHGNVRGCLGMWVDITERKRAEREREELLQREQAARAEAEAANRMKDDFLATVSHELRTPLNAMLGWADLLRSGELDETNAARAIEIIDRNAKAQAQLIEDLLDVSRMITGKLHLEVSPVELVPIIRAALDVVRPAAEAKAIQIRATLDPLVGPVLGDADRLQQIVWNLLSNAIKFTPHGGRVEVRLEAVGSRSEPQALIRVRDTGIGIDPAFLPYVFDRFRQADSSTTRKYSGLGLGLAVVRHLVEMHGGTVHADSAGEEYGAVFAVKLPLAKVRDSAISSPATLVPSSTDGVWVVDRHPVLHGVRVLVVDDELDTLKMLEIILAWCGAEVRAAASTTEAVEALKQWTPTLLISDIGMPDEDGYELIRRVRAMEPERGGTIPAIALTAYARAEDRRAALLAGYQVHVPKPIEPGRLVSAVAGLIGRGK